MFWKYAANLQENTLEGCFWKPKGAFTLQFSDNFFNYRKIRFHVNGANNYFIILCIFPNTSFWRQSIFLPSFFWNQNRLGFKKILEIKLLDKSIVSKKGWKRNKGKPTSQFSWSKWWFVFITTNYFGLCEWLKIILAFDIFCSVV